jgi:hypothetical protein
MSSALSPETEAVVREALDSMKELYELADVEMGAENAYEEARTNANEQRRDLKRILKRLRGPDAVTAASTSPVAAVVEAVAKFTRTEGEEDWKCANSAIARLLGGKGDESEEDEEEEEDEDEAEAE